MSSGSRQRGGGCPSVSSFAGLCYLAVTTLRPLRRSEMRKCLSLLLLGALAALPMSAPLSAQQTGSIQGTVTGPDGGVLPGVTVEASGDVGAPPPPPPATH